MTSRIMLASTRPVEDEDKELLSSVAGRAGAESQVISVIAFFLATT